MENTKIIKLKNPNRVVVDGIQMDLAVYEFNENVVIHLSNIKIGLLDREEKHDKVLELNAHEENLHMLFKIRDTNFAIVSRGTFSDMVYNENDCLTDVKFTNKIFVNIFRFNNHLINTSEFQNIYVAYDNNPGFVIKHHTDTQIHVQSSYSLTTNGTERNIDNETNRSMLFILKYKKYLGIKRKYISEREKKQKHDGENNNVEQNVRNDQHDKKDEYDDSEEGQFIREVESEYADEFEKIFDKEILENDVDKFNQCIITNMRSFSS